MDSYSQKLSHRYGSDSSCLTIPLFCVFFSVDDLEMILIITGGSASGVVVVVFVVYSARAILKVKREKKRKKKTEVDIKVVTMQEGILIYQQKEGATGVEKLDRPGPMKQVTMQEEIIIY